MIEELKDDIFVIFLDKTTHNGILRFTKEVTIWVRCPYKNVRNMTIFNIETLTSGDWLCWNPNELDDFENKFPGVINEAKNELRKHFNSQEKIML